MSPADFLAAGRVEVTGYGVDLVGDQVAGIEAGFGDASPEGVGRISRRPNGTPQPNQYKRGQPTVGFEPTTRCLQIRRQLNSA
jgi:hypothetical protein